MTQTVLILGANGRFGNAAAHAFDAAGWNVRALVRPGAKKPTAGEAVFADLYDPAALLAAGQGADVIVNALNPPYDKWEKAVPEITKAVIALAKATGATVLIPGNVYNYGTVLPEVLTETSPRVGDHSKAKIRIEMEAAYRAADIPTINLRAGDYIDTVPGDNWFEGQITKGVPKGKFMYPGPLNLIHAWAYLPDTARAAVMLAERRGDLKRFQEVNFPGYALTGAELTELVEAHTGPLKRVTFPWWALRLLSPFNPLMREVHDMRYLWHRPHAVGGDFFTELLPDFRATSATDAIRASLIATGRLAPVSPAVTKEAECFA